MIRIIFFFISLFLTTSCTEDIFPEMKQGYIVEGCIEAGSTPQVFVTKTVPLNEEFHKIDSLYNYIDMYANVYVSDEEKTVGLTGRLDFLINRYIPFAYETGHITGKEGGEYKLRIETNDKVMTSTCVIPKPHKMDTVYLKKVDSDKGLYQIIVKVKDIKPGEYGRFFVKFIKEKEEYFDEFFCVDQESINGDNGAQDSVTFTLNKPQKIYATEGRYFQSGEIIVVKLAMMTKEGYNIWRDFDRVMKLARNPLFPSTTNIPTNVTGAECGYWLGYNSDKVIIKIP